MGSQDVHSERQDHIDMVKGDVAPTVLTPGDSGRVEVFANLMNDAKKVAEKREYYLYRQKGWRIDKLYEHRTEDAANSDWSGGIDLHRGEEHHPDRDLWSDPGLS